MKHWQSFSFDVAFSEVTMSRTEAGKENKNGSAFSVLGWDDGEASRLYVPG